MALLATHRAGPGLSPLPCVGRRKERPLVPQAGTCSRRLAEASREAGRASSTRGWQGGILAVQTQGQAFRTYKNN